MTIEEIENIVREWVYTETGVETIFLHPNAPRPISQYIGIDILSMSEVGQKETESTVLENDSIDSNYSFSKQVVISIYTYYPGARQLAETIRNSLSKVTVSEFLYAYGLGYVTASNVLPLYEIIDKSNEERASFEVTFNYRTDVSENIETIKKVVVTNNINEETILIEG